MFLLQRQLEGLGINPKNLETEASLECLRLAKEKRKECLTIITYHTCKTQEEIFDANLVAERKATFERDLSDDDIAALMILCLTSEKTSQFIRHLGIDKEQDRMNMVLRVKSRSSKNNLTFGGKSQFGSLIDAACERYGWTKQYVVWGIDYTSLRLMLADKVTSVYCSDDELKKLPASVRNANEDVIRPTKENMKQILDMDWR